MYRERERDVCLYTYIYIYTCMHVYVIVYYTYYISYIIYYKDTFKRGGKVLLTEMLLPRIARRGAVRRTSIRGYFAGDSFASRAPFASLRRSNMPR